MEAKLGEVEQQNQQLQAKLSHIESILTQLQIQSNANVQSQVTQSIITQVPAPEKFTFRKEEWTAWIATYERYRIATNLNKQTEIAQINNLLLHMGSQVDRLLGTLGKDPEEILTYNQMKEVFSNHYVNKTNVIYERAKFNMRCQRENETAHEFVTDVIQLAKTCNYGSLNDDLTRDRLVVGIADQKLSESLQMDEHLTLERAIDKILQSERIRHQTNDIKQRSQHDTNDINRVEHKYYKKNNKCNYKVGKSESSKDKNTTYAECNRCGSKPSHQLKNCPALKVRCKRCKLKGHVTNRCRTKVVRQVLGDSDDETISESEIHKESEDSEQDFNINEIIKMGEITGGNNIPWNISLKCSGSPQVIQFKIDTGADETLITKHQYNKLGCKTKLEKTFDKLYTAGNKQLKVYGTAQIPIKWKNVITKIKMYVVETKDNLLGRPAINTLGLIKWIENIDITSEEYRNDTLKKFPKLFKGLGKVKNKSYDIKVKINAIPFSISTPRRVPVPLMDKVKMELQRMIKEDVIEPMEEASEWCAPMVVVAKNSGGIRICADFTELNKFIIREKLLLPSVDETLAQLKKATVFTKLDASSGFWQLELTKRSRHVTTFITPFGCFIYKRLPFGITSAPEVYQRTMNEIIGKHNGVLVHMDDIIIFGENQDEHDKRLNNILKLLQDNHITLNKKKCQFNVREIKFLGHIINQNGIQPNDDLTKTIRDFKQPTNVTEVRQFLGMVNHLTKFLKNAADETKAMRDLLRKDYEFTWTANQQKCFDNLKKILTTQPVLAMYDTKLETRISADASSYGIGGVLEQKQDEGNWRPVIYCSKSLSTTEQKYAQIEKETLALVWSCERLQQYLIGKHFLLRTDHKPLTAILKTKPINELTIRLQRMRMRLIRFDYDLEYVPGKEFYTADALSRCPEITGQNDQDVLCNEEFNMYINSIAKTLEHETSKTESEIEKEQQYDETFETIKRYVKHGWPNKGKCKKLALPFYTYRNEMCLHKNLLCYKDRIAIPVHLRKQILKKIHVGHQGIQKCQERAKMTMWWPNMSNNISDMVQKCETCLKNKNTETEPLINTIPQRIPWATVGADLCEWQGKTYLVIQDYYSKYMEALRVYKTNSTNVIQCLKSTFARFGIPETVRTDNGPQFNCYEFKTFAKAYNFRHLTSSPMYAQSNGLAERAVQTFKNILKKCEDPFLGLLAYRNTKLQCGASPAQLIMGRNLRDILPTTTKQLMPRLPNHNTVYENLKQEKYKQKLDFDNRHRTKILEPLTKNTRVWIIDQKREGRIIQQLEEPRSYTVETEKGEIRRNRKYLVALPTQSNADKPAIPETNPNIPILRRSVRVKTQPSKYRDCVPK